mgnify:CR=1 FL=1
MKGFRDFYPEDKRIQNWIFNTWKKIAEHYGYEEIEGPILEETEIYSKSGQEIPEQMYTFKDKSGKLITIRPETTPTIARMIKSKKELKLPIKWYSVSRCLRYERPQFGRSREFFQFNLDCLGSKNMSMDAEVITTSIKMMREFGLSKNDFYVRVSNRRLFNDLVNSIGIDGKGIQKIARILDKLCKFSDNEIEKELKKEKISGDKIKKLFTFLNIKDLNKIKIKSQGLDELKELFSYLKVYDIAKYCILDLSTMRGFDYYTGTVFEVSDKEKEFRAIAGGGRYDNLAGIPGVGYGMGDIVLELFLKKNKRIPNFSKNIDYYIAPVNKFVLKEAIKIAELLRRKYNIEIDLMCRNLRKQLNYASSINAREVIIIGEEELNKREVTIRDMVSGEEKKVKFVNLLR